MDIKKLLKELDDALLLADFSGAVNRFFDEKVKVISGKQKMAGKSEKLSATDRFLGEINKVNQVKLHGQTVSGEATYSLFTFDFSRKGGDKLTWYEIIRRKWKDGKVVEEEYITMPTDELVKAIFSGESATQKRRPRAVATKIAAKPAVKAAAKPTASSEAPVKKKRAPRGSRPKPGELRKITNLGKVVEKLMNDAGITTLAQFAKTSKTKIKEILQGAGPRFKEFDPTAWIEEAKTLAKQK